MSRKTLEVVVGLFVALGLAAFVMLALQVSGIARWGGVEGYSISARFDNVGGLREQAAVSMAGVRIGRVTAIRIDPDTFEAVVEMTIESRYDNLPRDTSASILTAGLLGEQYVGLEPGGALKSLEAGDSLKLTQSALVLEQLISQFLFRAAEGGGGQSSTENP